VHVIAKHKAHGRRLYGKSGFLPQNSGVSAEKIRRACKRGRTAATTLNRKQSGMWRGDSPVTTLPITQKGLVFVAGSFSVPTGLSIAGLANGDIAVAWQDGFNEGAVQLFSPNGTAVSNEFEFVPPAASIHPPTRMSSRSPTAISSRPGMTPSY
jgi:hypothetical protein